MYPEQLAEGSDGVFPDGQPFPRSAWGKRGRFVYVWWTWGEDGSVLRSRRCWAVPVPDCGVPAGRYWQVVDGATSQLTVGTDGVALGSYTMEVVVYHYRGRQRFIPIGHASTQFSITGRQRWGGWAGRGHGVPMLTSPCPHADDVPTSPRPGAHCGGCDTAGGGSGGRRELRAQPPRGLQREAARPQPLPA